MTTEAKLFSQEKRLREANRKVLLSQVARCVRQGLTDNSAAARLGVGRELVRACREELGLERNPGRQG